MSIGIISAAGPDYRSLMFIYKEKLRLIIAFAVVIRKSFILELPLL